MQRVLTTSHQLRLCKKNCLCDFEMTLGGKSAKCRMCVGTITCIRSIQLHLLAALLLGKFNGSLDLRRVALLPSLHVLDRREVRFLRLHRLLVQRVVCTRTKHTVLQPSF